MTCVCEATMQRKLNHVLEVEFNFVGCQRISESIERLLQLGFEVLQSAQSFVQCCFIHQTTRSVDEQTNIVVKLEFRWKFDIVHFNNPPLYHRVAPCGLAEPLGAELRYSFLRLEVHVDQAKAVAVSVHPLEVVLTAPEKV